ncbi:hypothetical protein KAR91_12030 [Candidatus Pacearchaeota archaeon]|nr:hypothetical protein [Candidatus Pacearchaeota archaeon]
MRKEMKRLILSVEKIDPEAAKYLREEAPLRGDFVATTGHLDRAMGWDLTPQGWEFWNKIYQQLLSDELEDLK